MPPSLSVSPSRLQSGMNLQICFVNDSGSDKDSDADDSKTETSLDTPLSPMVRTDARMHPGRVILIFLQNSRMKKDLNLIMIIWNCQSVKILLYKSKSEIESSETGEIFIMN